MKLSEEEFDLYRLKYTLSMYLVRQVILADETINEKEIQFVREHFPIALLQSLDLLKPEETAQLLERALFELPNTLSLQAKLDIVGICFAASAADNNVDAREIGTIQVAAEVLNVPSGILIKFIQDLLE